MVWIVAISGADSRNELARQTYYTQNTFSSSPKPLLAYTSRCLFAHEKKEFGSASGADVPDSLIFCAAYEPPSTDAASAAKKPTFSDAISSLLGGPPRALKESRLYSSTDWFSSEHEFVDLGIGKEARGVVGIGGVQKYLVTALKPSAAQSGSGGTGGGSAAGGGGEMVMYVTEDGKTWSRAQFPHGHGLRENAYTIVESTEHSILVDVNSSPGATAGTLFTSNSNGTYFVRSLENTNRNRMGIVDFEKIVGVEGVAIINTVQNVDAVEAGKEDKDLKTKITFDDGAFSCARWKARSLLAVRLADHHRRGWTRTGGHWTLIPAPPVDHKGKKVKCDVSDIVSSGFENLSCFRRIDSERRAVQNSCSLHLHSVTQPHNYGRVFSSTAPGLVMGVGTIGSRLLPYDECDTFLSTDAGLTWKMVEDGAMKYEFGDRGSLLLMVEDEEPTDEIKYSFDYGKTW